MVNFVISFCGNRVSPLGPPGTALHHMTGAQQFIPEFCLIKILCSVGIRRVGDEKTIGYIEMDAESKKAMHLTKLIKQYKELA